jgi:hypothetical protein
MTQRILRWLLAIATPLAMLTGGPAAAAFNQAIATGITKWAGIVKDLGIKPE